MKLERQTTIPNLSLLVTTPMVPGEWEPQKATWMQWPPSYEQSLRPTFAQIISVVAVYQPVYLIVLNEFQKTSATNFLTDQGVDLGNITFVIAPYDNSWLRDNGPVYIMDRNTVAVQDWGFDAWGGNFGPFVAYEDDNRIPETISQITNLEYEDHNDYILERGNLESNGHGIVILNWDCQVDRNPNWTQAETEQLFLNELGAHRVIWCYGHDPLDGTTGHIDGYVRIISDRTVAVARSLIPNDPTAQMMEEAATTLRLEGFEVVRIDVPGTIMYGGAELPAMYMNWLVGNGFVLAMAFGNSEWDQAARQAIQDLYPYRQIHMLESNELWLNGGGIHCVTNDQPDETAVLGDIDRNSSVNLIDAVHFVNIREHVQVPDSYQAWAADLDRNGLFTETDFLLLLPELTNINP